MIVIRTENAPKPPAYFSQAVKSGGFVFVAGQGPFDQLFRGLAELLHEVRDDEAAHVDTMHEDLLEVRRPVRQFLPRPAARLPKWSAPLLFSRRNPTFTE